MLTLENASPRASISIQIKLVIKDEKEGREIRCSKVSRNGQAFAIKYKLGNDMPFKRRVEGVERISDAATGGTGDQRIGHCPGGFGRGRQFAKDFRGEGGSRYWRHSMAGFKVSALDVAGARMVSARGAGSAGSSNITQISEPVGSVFYLALLKL